MKDQTFVRLVWGAILTIGLACWGLATLGFAHVVGMLG
jgi:hypothetical protein